MNQLTYMTSIVALSMMGKRNPVHILLLLLVILASYVSAERYYIVPNDSISQCQNYSAGICFTLIEFASNSSHIDQDNLRLSFLPGQHLLTRRATITGPQNITLTGQNSSNSLSTIKCQGTSGFEFGDIKSLNIAYIVFTGCGKVERGGSIHIGKADNILIRGCHFTDNHLLNALEDVSKGGVIYAENVAAMNIENSLFDNNYGNITCSNDYNSACAYSRGGAIYVSSGDITSTNNSYINNSAHYGGAIFVYSGNISSTNDYYINNSAHYGGVSFVYSGSISCTNDHYINNSAVHKGGAIYVSTGDITSTNDHYTNNSANNEGGAICVYSGNITSTNDHYMSNSADSKGGAILIHSGNITSTNDHYMSNSADSKGGAIYVSTGDITSTNDHYINNSAYYNSGAIYVYYGDITTTNDHYINNSADSKGGAILVHSGNIASTDDYYLNNSANSEGGAICVYSGSITSTNDHYMSNSANYDGGAIYVYYGDITSTNDHYINNSADYNGGAIYVSHGDITSTNDSYITNSAKNNGGAIFIFTGSICSTNSYYVNNRADVAGGVLSVNSGSISSTSNYYIKNSADRGGAIYVTLGSDTKLSSDNFEHNSAVEGAVIYKTEGALEIAQSNITDNFASSRGSGTVYMNSGSLSISEGVNFMNNRGSIYIFNTHVEFKGTVAFLNNSGDSEGAITAIFSEISFNTASIVTIRNNTAINGGGISLTQSNMHVYHSIELTDNHAIDFGGGIYAYQSDIEFKPKQKQRSEITKNTASNGGAVCAIASNVHISNTSMEVNSNIAKVNGGAIYLEQNSKIYVQKHEIDNTDLRLNVRLDFTHNTAEKGGAIYVADNTNDGVLCQGANTAIYQTECFIQTLGLYRYQILKYHENLINTFFTNNTAHQSGSDIYGGLLDRCSINQNAELLRHYPEFRNLSGFDYVKATTQIEQIIDYSHYQKPHYFIENISKSDVKRLISSDAVRVEFCLENVNYSHPNVSIKKGENFTVGLVAVDQVGNPLNATIINSFQSESENGRLKEGQVEQQVGNQCTQLEYNVYSQDNSAQLHIHADGPCGDKGVSRKTLNVILLPCTCPVGFEPSPGPSGIDCVCECDQTLKQHQITSCSSENKNILLETNIWIGLFNYTNETEFVIHDCPFDFCVEKPVNISLSSPDSAAEQCAYNRTGILCGMCKENLSLVFGSSRCQECSNNYISLLIPFALAGIALVTFILLLNMTVATGTIHGLIYYANILTANHSLLLPPSTSNILTVFISWLNLDLGIETCFYNGMDSYSKFLLQLAFPTYVFVLIGTIVVLCEVSNKFASLLSNRNPVAALCTLILLSYSKFIRIIITALKFARLDYPDGPREIVWLYDANVQYFTVNHIPRFIAAFIIIILGAIYTILLLFGQWFPHCSNRKIMKWTKNTKYNAFIDAYHAPFTPKHRYWLGLLLFAQITHNLVAAMTTDSLIAIFAAGCIALGLILLRVFNTRIYKNSLQDSLETLFLTNIVIMALATFYIRENNKDQFVTYHIRETNEGQLILANTSMAISFILFLIILGYHFYKYILKGMQVWARLSQLLQRILQHRDRLREFELVPLDGEDNEQDEQMIETQQPYTDDNDTGPIDLPHHYDPPVIVPAVRYDQPREPDLDILDPITTDDYRQLNQFPAPRPQQVPTCSVIDFVRPRRNV